MPLTQEQLVFYQTTLLGDLRLFLPEVIIAATIALTLLARLFRAFQVAHMHLLASMAVAAALVILGAQWVNHFEGARPHHIFSQMLLFDAYSLYIRSLLLIFACLALWIGLWTGIPDREDSADYSTFLLGGTLGMMLMASANHLVMVFIAMEMASLPCYALAGFLKGRRSGSEAALKYVLYGSAASGVALYGISLLVARFGTATIPGLADGLAASLQQGWDPLSAIGVILLFAGLGFKLSVVPFHFWCPDVFEGASAEVGAFLSIASKAAAVALTGRFLIEFQQKCAFVNLTLLRETLGLGLLIIAAITVTLGNLAALNQTNLKRMLAYSTIAHAGVMLAGLATLTQHGTAASLYYIAAYLPANLIAFLVVAIVRNRGSGETVDDLRGLMVRSPGLALGLIISFLSLLGLPPTGGFAGKFMVFESLFELGQTSSNIILGVLVLNTVLSAGYYLRVIRVAVLDDATDSQPLNEPAPIGIMIGGLAVVIVLLGIVWNMLLPFTDAAVNAR